MLAVTSDAQAYKQAGNSVTVNVVESIGRRFRAVDEELKAGAAHERDYHHKPMLLATG